MDEWNTKKLLEGKTEENNINELKKLFNKFKGFRKKLNNKTGPETVKEIVVLKDKIMSSTSRISVYYELQFCENTNNPNILAKISHLGQMLTDLFNEIIFFSLWFMRINKKQAEKIMNSPKLKEYKYYLEETRKDEPYTKTEEIEKIISIKSLTGSNALSTVYDLITTDFKFDIDGKKGIPQEEATSYYQSPNPKLREEAYEQILGKFKENSTVLNELYKNIVIDWCSEGIKIRGYKSPITIRNKGNDISDKTVEVMLKVIRKNSHVFAEYFKIKHDLIQQKGVSYPHSRYHLYAPYSADLKENYSYEKSKKITLQTFKEFDLRFYTLAKEIFDDHHVHSHPAKNKKAGAFCCIVNNYMSPYIMLNHSDTLRDLFVIMHEFGHGIHSQLSRKQSNLLMHSAIPMAETASIFGELMLAEKMLKESKDKEEKMYILIRQLDDRYASILRQAYFVVFEKYVHDNINNGLTKEDLDKKYYELLKEQFGSMEIPELFKHEWNYIPHIHHTPFYCYAYAWGNLMVLSLFAMYREQGKKFIEKYVRLLEAGGSDKPERLLKNIMGITINEEFWQKGFDIIKEEIKELKRLAK